MIQRIGVVAVGFAWAFVLFLCTGWLSFPGDAVAKRVVYEVNNQSRGAYQLELGDLQPWWFGLKTDDLKVFGKAGADGTNPLLALATDARASASPFSLLARTPSVSGSVTLGLDGQVDYAVSTAMDAEGQNLLVTEVHVASESFPVGELLALAPSYEGGADGTLALHADIAAPEGMGSANGSVVLRGQRITLTSPVIMDFPLGRDVVISDLDIELEVEDGKAKVSRGRLVTDLANADITGNIVLAEPFARSTVDLRIEAELDASMAAMATMLKSAEVNGKLVWRCNGRIDQLARVCTPGDQPKAARGRNTNRNRGARRNRAANRPNRVNRPGAATGLSDEEREKRREELQERLRKRRERRAANRAERPDREPADQPGDMPEDDELPLPPEELDLEDDLGDDEMLEEDEEFVDEEFVDEQ